MPSVVTSLRLDVYCKDSDKRNVLSGIENLYFNDEVIKANLSLEDDIPDFSNVNLNEYFTAKTNILCTAVISRFLDRFSMLNFLAGKAVKYNNVSIVPHHEFLLSNNFSYFTTIHSGKTFDLIEVSDSGLNIIATGVLENLIRDYEHLQRESLGNVYYSNTARYFFRLHREDITSVFGCFYYSETETGFTSSLRLDESLQRLIKNAFSNTSGFFEISYYVDNNKFIVYEFSMTISDQMLNDRILQIREVQKTFEIMSQKHAIGIVV